eukprot:CCRYP_015566-RA/>CCRYP_015566-RA protein AED:0.39 eAED:0.39 QI:10/1/1/1/0/0/3/97/58
MLRRVVNNNWQRRVYFGVTDPVLKSPKLSPQTEFGSSLPCCQQQLAAAGILTELQAQF